MSEFFLTSPMFTAFRSGMPDDPVLFFICTCDTRRPDGRSVGIDVFFDALGYLTAGSVIAVRFVRIAA